LKCSFNYQFEQHSPKITIFVWNKTPRSETAS
jgi:hypothetical protein